MADTIIRVEGLGKKYRLRQQQSGHYVALRDQFSDYGKRIGRRLLKGKDSKVSNQEDFWALKDISFEISKGDRIGVIGRNGAGKSTLLKILSRITEPTKGFIDLHGRVASLLEVGTGFHPELTGRENIFLNAAILGMSRVEISQKFDEIVDFAEVERFLDTPVKRYSSGMYVKLAFSVAAHLEPEILIVDEVLAVGDLKFQRKCLGKMDDVSREGRTVIFVSHQMSALESLCNNGIVLEHGSISYLGDINSSIQHYLNSLSSQEIVDLRHRRDRQGRGQVRMTRISIEDDSGRKELFSVGSRLKIHLSYEAVKCLVNCRLIIGVYNSKNIPVVRFDTEVAGFEVKALKENGTLLCSTEEINLVPGIYTLNVALMSNSEIEDYVSNASSFEIVSSDYFGTGKSFESNLTCVLVGHRWEFAE